MQRLDFDRVSSVAEIKKQIEEMVLDKSLTEKEAKVIMVYRKYIISLKVI